MKLGDDMEINKIFSKVFLWMFIGLAITFGIAYYVSTNDNMVYNLFAGSKYLIFWILEFVVVLVLSARIHKLSSLTAKILFLLYSGLTGLTLSSIFILYDITSIVYVFAITSGLFLAFGLLGYFTNIDLTKFGTYLMMALFGIIIASIINLIIGSETFDYVLCILGIILFLGYTAYDIQVVKKNLYGIENEDNLVIYGALQLYLDFINLFLRLLQLFGKNRD